MNDDAEENMIGITIEEIAPDEKPAKAQIPSIIFVIPYRDRKEHLEQFRRHMKMVMEDIESGTYRFLIVHQCDTKSFNRGAMKNIGFITASRLYPNDYRNMTFVFNDVDSMPMRKNMWDYKTTHGIVKHYFGFDYTLGGIVSITGYDYERIGGFPNYWGWGYEDNELQKRVEKARIKIDRSIFFNTMDTNNIIQLNHGPLRIMNKDDFEKFSTNGIGENLYTIKELNYQLVPEAGSETTIDIDFVNVSFFRTGYEEVKKEQFVYNLKNGNRPIVSFKRKNGNPKMLMKFI